MKRGGVEEIDLVVTAMMKKMMMMTKVIMMMYPDCGCPVGGNIHPGRCHVLRA